MRISQRFLITDEQENHIFIQKYKHIPFLLGFLLIGLVVKILDFLLYFLFLSLDLSYRTLSSDFTPILWTTLFVLAFEGFLFLSTAFLIDHELSINYTEGEIDYQGETYKLSETKFIKKIYREGRLEINLDELLLLNGENTVSLPYEDLFEVHSKELTERGIDIQIEYQDKPPSIVDYSFDSWRLEKKDISEEEGIITLYYPVKLRDTVIRAMMVILIGVFIYGMYSLIYYFTEKYLFDLRIFILVFSVLGSAFVFFDLSKSVHRKQFKFNLNKRTLSFFW